MLFIIFSVSILCFSLSHESFNVMLLSIHWCFLIIKQFSYVFKSSMQTISLIANLQFMDLDPGKLMIWYDKTWEPKRRLHNNYQEQNQTYTWHLSSLYTNMHCTQINDQVPNSLYNGDRYISSFNISLASKYANAPCLINIFVNYVDKLPWHSL